MKRLYKNITLILFPILIVLTLIPIDRRLKYQELKNDCFQHGIWIYDRLYNNDKPIEIAFLGSSRTINGINDKLIEEKIGNPQMNLVNFGYCRPGRNLHYIIAQDILKTKTLKKLIVEVRDDEDRYSHPIFPYIAENNDILLASPFFNRDIFIDLYHYYGYKLQLLQETLFKKNEPIEIQKMDFGYGSSPDTADARFLLKFKESERFPQPANKLERDFYMKFPRSYLRKIHQLCVDHNVELTFIYLPSFGSNLTKPLEIETYRKYGKVLFPPAEIFENMDYWHDEDHFNNAGAVALSAWIAEELKN